MKRFSGISVVSLFCFVPLQVMSQNIVMENDSMNVVVEQSTGSFHITEKVTGQKWWSDPWEKTPGVLRVQTPNGRKSLNLSECENISVSRIDPETIQIVYEKPVDQNKNVYGDVAVTTEIRLVRDHADLEISIIAYHDSGTNRIIDLIYPARSFFLASEVDSGLAVIPYHSGVVVPSYLFPLPSSQFGEWTDWHHQGEMIFEFRVYGNLRMPWYGIYSLRSGVFTLLPRDGSVNLQYIQNYNDRARILKQTGQESRYPNILALSPVWKLAAHGAPKTIRYHFMPDADYVDMAKYYRSLVQAEGGFVSLREKVKKTPEVHKLIGDIYLHVFGGYPHRTNQPGMAFTFEEIERIAADLHDSLKVNKAFLTLWGTWENYPPMHWPVNEKAGGQEKFVEVIDKIKSYGYLVTQYHNFNCMLPWDPNYTTKYYARDNDGKAKYSIVWNMIDDKYSSQLALDVLKKENEILKTNAIYTDCKQGLELRQYLQSLNQPVTSERTGNSELLIPYYHRLEGVVPNAFKSHTMNFIEAPLFNLVYHDAIVLSKRWQFPDNEYDINGDYAVKALRNMIYGNETMYVTPVWAYPGIRNYIRNAVRLLAPLHEETGFEELAGHKYLSQDFTVQRSTFGNGTVVTVNLGLLDRKLPDGTLMPGYGFQIQHQDGRVTTGQFKTSLDIEETMR
jgi:hypothetical protein